MPKYLENSSARFRNKATIAKTGDAKSVAYLSNHLAEEEKLESKLCACKLRYSIVKDTAGVARYLLRSGRLLGNFQKPAYEDVLTRCRAFAHARPATTDVRRARLAEENVGILVSVSDRERRIRHSPSRDPRSSRPLGRLAARESTSCDGERTRDALPRRTNQFFSALR
jgi:hypothetical protein